MKYLKTSNQLLLGIIFCIIPILANAQKLQLDSTSTVSIVGTSTLHDWKVKVEQFEGFLELDKDLKKASKNLKEDFIKSTSLSFEVASMKGGRGETMDNKIYKALKKEEQPTITFISSDVAPIEKDDAEAKVWVESKGVVKIAGVEKEVSIQLGGNTDGNSQLTFKGKLPLKMSDFNIEPPSAMFGQIVTGDGITLNFDLVFAQD